MIRLRIVGGITAAALALYGCSGERTGLAADTPPGGVSLARPTVARGASPSSPIEENFAADSSSKLQRTGFVSRPRIVAALGAEAGLPEPQGAIAAYVIARVNGEPILFQELWTASLGRRLEFKGKVKAEQWPEVEQEIFKAELESLIDRELLLQDAKANIRAQGWEKVREAAEKDFDAEMRKRRQQLSEAQGSSVSEEQLRDFLRKQGTSWEEQKRLHERRFVAYEYLRSRLKEKFDLIDRAQMLEYYQKNRKEFEKPERVRWQYVYVDVDHCKDEADAKGRAEEAHAAAVKVKREDEWAEIAKKYSHGDEWRKGEGEGTERGQIRPAELENVVFGLKTGEVGPMVELRGSQGVRGYYVLRCVDHTSAGRVPFDEACPEVRRKLQTKIWQAESSNLVKELRGKAHIESGLASN